MRVVSPVSRKNSSSSYIYIYIYIDTHIHTLYIYNTTECILYAECTQAQPARLVEPTNPPHTTDPNQFHSRPDATHHVRTKLLRAVPDQLAPSAHPHRRPLILLRASPIV
jgi:hypothetical protein